MLGIEKLPQIIPVFPLTGVLLLPKGYLPLNIFEPRYLQMVRDIREGAGVIGMIQPCGKNQRALGKNSKGHFIDADGHTTKDKVKQNRPLYQTGCLGMITDIEETDDGHIILVLTGLSRFNVVEELIQTKPYRQVQADYSPYAHDGTANKRSKDIDRAKLVVVMQQYLKERNVDADWASFEVAPDEELINSLAMMCPFKSSEKQALMEIGNIKDRLELMVNIMEFSLSSTLGSNDHNMH